MYDGGIRCCHRDTECGIYSNSLLTLLLFCKLQTILKLKHIFMSTRNKQGVKNQLLTLRFPGSFINELQRGDMERKNGNLRYREGSRALLSSNPCLNPEPVTPELLRKYLHPLTGLGQSFLSDSDHKASCAFPVQKWREKSGRAPVWPQG